MPDLLGLDPTTGKPRDLVHAPLLNAPAKPKRDLLGLDATGKPRAGKAGSLLGKVPASTPPAAAKKPPPAPLWTGITQALGAPNLSGAMIGAFMRDASAHRNPFAGSLTSRQGVTAAPGSAVEHALRGIHQGHLQETVDEYFPLGTPSLKQFAKDDRRAGITHSAAQTLVDHPRVASVVDFLGRLADPGNALFGEALGIAGRGVKAGIGAGGRAAADAITKAKPAEEFSKKVMALRAAGDIAVFKRFAVVRAAAEHVARKAGKSAADIRQAGDRAEMAARNVANAEHEAKAQGQYIRKRMMGGLTHGEQLEVYHLIEGDSTLPPGPLRDKLMGRVDFWRTTLHALDKDTRSWLGDDARFLSSNRYAPRQGFARNADADPLSEGEEALIERSRSRGGVTVRKGTLGQNMHRKYATLKQAQAMATATGKFDLNPDWTPAQAIEEFVTNRVRSFTIAKQFNTLDDVGLLSPKFRELVPGRRVFEPLKPPLPTPGINAVFPSSRASSGKRSPTISRKAFYATAGRRNRR
jgi:hypothetical protein